jgi:hypothetical protein
LGNQCPQNPGFRRIKTNVSTASFPPIPIKKDAVPEKNGVSQYSLIKGGF